MIAQKPEKRAREGDRGPFIVAMVLIFFIGVFFINLGVLFPFQISVYTLEPLPFDDYREVKKENICAEKRLLIYGIRAYLDVKKIRCPSQLRVVGNVLYVSEVYEPQDVYVLPLPNPESLRRYGNIFVVFHSRYTSFYVEELKKHLSIKQVQLSHIYELERELPKALTLGHPLLILPDPIFFDERAMHILNYWLRKHDGIPIVDLANLNLKHPKKFTHRISKQKYFKTLREVFLLPNLIRGKIYYVEE